MVTARKRGTSRERGSGMTNDIGMVSVLGCRCRCGHEWLPRKKGERPAVCPKCKSPLWDRPRQDTR